MDAFVKAAVLPPAPTVTVNTQSDESGIPLNWNSLDGASSYKVEVKGPTAASFSEAERTSSISFKYQTTVPGSFTFKVVPVVEFFNKSDSIAEKFGPASEEKSGAVKLSDTAWIKLVMQTMMKGQASLPDRSNSVTGEKVSFSKYSTILTTSDHNEAFQAYCFSGYEDVNNSIKVQGVLFHIYLGRNDTGLCVSYSGGIDSWKPDYDDTNDKKSGTISIDGVYPGEIQVWGKNIISKYYDPEEFWTDSHPAMSYIKPASGKVGIYIIDDYADWQNFSELDYLKSSWGFIEIGNKQVPINTSTAYSIKRSGQSSFTNYNFSQVGALQ